MGIMSNRAYDFWKWVALILLPAVATFTKALGIIWGMPYVDEIVATLVAIDTFLGAVLQISSNGYYADVLTEGIDPDAIEEHDEILEDAEYEESEAE